MTRRLANCQIALIGTVGLLALKTNEANVLEHVRTIATDHARRLSGRRGGRARENEQGTIVEDGLCRRLVGSSIVVVVAWFFVCLF
jgi:hypothetical protein